MFPTEKIVSSIVADLLIYASVLGILLLVGIILRSKIKLLKKLFLPASLIGGTIGLMLSEYGLGILPAEMTSSFAALPGTLIVIVFAPMLIGMERSKEKNGIRDLAIPQMIVGFLGSLIQVAIPCLVTVFILSPIWNVNELFPSIVEIGWAGGHGTAGGMAEVFEKLNWADGVPLSLMSATVGLLFGIIGGMIIINHGIRKGYLSKKNNLTAAKIDEQADFRSTSEKVASSYETINKNISEGFAFHFALIGVAVIIGKLIQYLLGFIVDGLPLFPMAMLGGLLIHVILSKLDLLKYVDVKTFQRIQGVCLDFLVVAAVASIKITVIVDYALPIFIISVVSMLIMLWFFYWLCPRIFKEDWFEQGILHFGVITGVTAVGFMLLRTVDPDMNTVSSKGYALQAPITSPLLGGGLLTAILPSLILSYGNLVVGLVCLGLTIVGIFIAMATGCWRKGGLKEISK